jgi:2-keto-3-deoxy-L-rhamnonate aldolase RhmA
MLAARASGIDAFVRVEGLSAIATALDCGATGVMVPQVFSAEVAKEVVQACRYRTGHRGFSNSTRAGSYGRFKLSEHVEVSDQQTTIIAMLEDPRALDEIDAITAVDGIDAYFLGRSDLTVALGEVSTESEMVRSAILKFVNAVVAVRKPLWAFVTTSIEMTDFCEL